MHQIVHLTSIHHKFDTRIFYRECKSLVDAGYDVHLIAPSSLNEERDGIRIHALDPGNSRTARITHRIWLLLHKAWLLHAEIYHLHDPELLPIAFILDRCGKCVVFDFHENVPAQILHKDRLIYPRIISKVYSILEKLFITRSMSLVLAEQSYYQHYSQINSKCIVVQNFPSVPHKSLISSKKENAIVYVGRIGRHRGLDQILQALAILREKGLTPKFYCIGLFSTPEYEKELYKLVKILGIEEQVLFYGWMDNPKALDIIRNSKIGLSILHPVPNYLESYSTKIFEYMGLGIPFISSDFPLYRKLLSNAGKCGILLNPLDTVSIADSIQFLLEHPSYADAMGKIGRQAIEKIFNWACEEKKLLKLYEHLLQKPKIASA